jgi:uncharacterized membrane protein YhaH (DUF805 family)
MNWYLDVLKKYAVFSGRARRKEYWMFTLFNVIITIILAIIDSIVFKTSEGNIGILGVIYALAVFLPSLGVTVRRLHDTGRTGWWALIGIIPILGWLVLLIFMVLDSQPGANEYGPNPKEIGYA